MNGPAPTSAPHAVVTGATGFLGARIAEVFRARGARVTGLSRRPADQDDACRAVPTADWAGEIARLAPDMLIHCAGSSSVAASMTDPAADFAAGPVLTFALLDALRTSAPGCRFVFLSSAAVYGDPVSLPIGEDHAPRPLSPYGFHKLQCETLAREFAEIYGLPTASLRIFSAYGAGLRRQVVWDICARAAAGEPLLLHGTGAETRDFVHADDVAEAAWLVASSAPMRGECYNVASGEETRIDALAATIVRLGDHAGTEIRFDGRATPGNPINWRADIARLRGLGFAPRVMLDDGLASIVR